MRTFRPAAPGSTSQTQPARNRRRAHSDCVQPLPPPDGVLTDGVVIAACPAGRDAGTFAGCAAGQAGGLGEAWLPLPYAGAFHR